MIFRSYVFGPSGFWTMAPLCYAAKFDPFLSFDCAPLPPHWRNPRNGRDQILPSGNLGVRLNELELSSGSILEKARAAFVAKLAKGEVPDPTPEPEEDEVCSWTILV